jgi:hypothetical protein
MRTMGEFFYDPTTQQTIDADWLEWHKLPRRRAEPVIRVDKRKRDNFRKQEEDALPDEWDISDVPEPTESDIRNNWDDLHKMGVLGAWNDSDNLLDPALVDKWFNEGWNGSKA